jgi:hypothetical protein
MRNEAPRRAVETAVNQSMRALLLALIVAGLYGSSLSAAEILPIDKVQKGMKGYGVTVFEGSKSERFDVEILGVLRNTGPDQDLILARVDHEVIGRAGVIAGMSGSPIYIDGKVIGALAYSWQFAKEPIAGITPIEEMLRIGQRSAAPAGAAPAGRLSTDELLKSLLSRDPAAQMEAALQGFRPAPSAISGALPIAIPIAFSNFSAETLQRFAPWFESRGFMPVPSGTAGAGGAKTAFSTFKPGDSIAGVLVSGDFSIASTGTVSHVDGDKVFAFGHPFLDMGEISFPMATSEVVTVLPNVARSFKMSNAGEIVGTFKQDRAAGILGITGLNESMIPVEMTVDGPGGPKTYRVNVVRHPQLSPLLIAMAADSVVTGTQRAAGQRTIMMESEIEIDGFAPIRLQDGWAGNQAREAIPSYLAVISSYLLANEFRDASIKGVKIRLRHDDAIRTAKITEASIIGSNRGRISPGDTVKVRTVLRPYRGEPFEQVFDLRIPDNQRPGPAYLFVGSGSAMNQVDFSIVPPSPRTLEQVVRVVERLRSSTDLTVGLYSPSPGLVTAGVYLPDLPPSMGAIKESDTSNSGRAPVRYFAPEHLSRPMDFIVDGWVRVDLNIKPKV